MLENMGSREQLGFKCSVYFGKSFLDFLCLIFLTNKLRIILISFSQVYSEIIWVQRKHFQNMFGMWEVLNKFK